MHWLPKRVAPAVISSGVRTAARLIETLSAPASSSAAHVLHGADAAAHGERDEDAVGHAAHHVDDDIAALVAGGDVQEDQLVGALAVVDLRLLDRIAGVAQVEKVDPLDHAAVLDVQAGDDAFGEHGVVLRAGYCGDCAGATATAT